MNTKIIILFIALVTLTNSISATHIYKASNDTVPEKAALNQEETKTENLNDLEKELDNLSNKSIHDTTKIRIGKMKIAVIDEGKDIIINKEDSEDWDKEWNWDDDDFSFGDKKDKSKFDPHWAGIGISMNGFLNANQEMSLPDTVNYFDLNTNKSIQLDINFAEVDIPIAKNWFGLCTGVGFRWNNYHLSNTNIVLEKGASNFSHSIDTVNSYTKSKFGVTYLTVPLLVEFQFPINKEKLYISAGVEGSVKLTAKMKNKNKDGIKTKNKSDFYINPFSYDLTARLGYGGFGIYGVYNMQSFFKKDKGPELYPFALGFTLNF